MNIWSTFLANLVCNECILFQNLTNLDRSERNAPRSQSKSNLLRRIWENLT